MKCEVGDYVRSFHIDPVFLDCLTPGKLYIVEDIFLNNFISITDDTGEEFLCEISTQGVSLKKGQQWEILSYSSNLEKILE